MHVCVCVFVELRHPMLRSDSGGFFSGQTHHVRHLLPVSVSVSVCVCVHWVKMTIFSTWGNLH